MNINNIICLCGNEFNKFEFKKHYKKCKLFFERFKNLDMRISFLLNKYLSIKENIILVRFLFKRYINLIDKKIYSNKKESQKPKNNYIKDIIISYDIKNKISNNFHNKNEILSEKNKNKTFSFNQINSTDIIKKSFIYENIINNISKLNDYNKKDNNQNYNNKNKLNFVKEIIEEQKNFYSSFPAPIINGNLKKEFNKCSAIKRHSIFIPRDNEMQIHFEKNFYLNWRIIGNINSDTGYLIVKRFKSILENENHNLDEIRIKFGDYYKDDSEIVKSKKKNWN